MPGQLAQGVHNLLLIPELSDRPLQFHKLRPDEEAVPPALKAVINKALPAVEKP